MMLVNMIQFFFNKNLWYIFAELNLIIIIIYLIFVSATKFKKNTTYILGFIIIIFCIQFFNYLKYELITLNSSCNLKDFLYTICVNEKLNITWLTFSLNSVQIKLLILFLFSVIIVFFIWFVLNLAPFLKNDLAFKKNFIFNINKEFLILVLINILFSLLVLKANNLFVLWAFLEMVSISSYLLIVINYSIAIQYIYLYFIFNGLAGAFILWGCSLLNLFNINNFNIYLVDLDSYSFDFDQLYTINFGILILVFGFFIKLGLFPFHFWAIEVYDYLSTKLFFFFVTINKLLILFSLFICLRLFFYFNLVNLETKYIICSLISFTIIFGSIAAFNENNFQRFLVLASLPQMGYILFGFFTNSLFIIINSIGYVYIYILTLLGIYLCLNWLQIKIIYLSDLKNLININKNICYVMLCLFFSLAGLPPFIGFTAKFLLLQNFILNSYYLIVIIILISSIISLIYYLRICIIFFQTTEFTSEVTKNYFIIMQENKLENILTYFINKISYLFIWIFLFIHNYYIIFLKYLQF